MKSALLPLFLICLFSACAAPAPQSSSVSAGMPLDAWKDRRINEAVDTWGAPDAVTREGAFGVLSWRADNAAGEPPAPELPPGMVWVVLCARTLTVDASGIIVQAIAQGSECSTEAADYAP